VPQTPLSDGASTRNAGRGKWRGDSLPILNGYAVGDMACKLYPGVMVEYDSGLPAAIKETARLVAYEQVQRIHEATFSFDNVLVRVDLLERTDAGWILTEVKVATSRPFSFLTNHR